MAFDSLVQQAHNVVLTLLQRPYDVATLHGRCNDVETTSCACWDVGISQHIILSDKSDYIFPD